MSVQPPHVCASPDDAIRAPDSTLRNVRGRQRTRVRWTRRIALSVLALIVALGATGMLGVRSSTASASGGGWSMEVRYPKIARAGLDVPWRVTVRHPGGFGDQPITLAVSARYFDIFETQAFHPEPSKSTADGEFMYLEFDPPPGDVFAVDYDAYIQPSSQIGRSAKVQLMDEDRVRLTVRYRTWLLP